MKRAAGGFGRDDFSIFSAFQVIIGILEDDGYDVSTIVSSLVQICADKYYRTISGLNVLIEKEWIALGHPFGRNIFHCTVSSRVKVGSVSQFFFKNVVSSC